MRGLRVIVTGLIAQHPRLGGVTWDYLQYLLGLDRLGCRVTYVEDSGQWPYRFDGDGRVSGGDENAQYLSTVLEAYRFRGPWAYRSAPDGRWFGMSESARQRAVREAELLLNISGSMIDPRPYGSIPRRAYVDTDPAFTQIRACTDDWFRSVLSHFNVHFTFGETLSTGPVPDGGFRWLPTRSPVIPGLWATDGPERRVFTTVMNWVSYRPVTFQGVEYAQKDAEFLKFLTLPARVPKAPIEVALPSRRHTKWETGALPAHETPEEVLRSYGWRTEDALRVAGSPESYRRYVSSSMAEWSIAKGGYVAGQTGWFSCRSACYLAAGRPVVVQDTGFSIVIPCGEGILPFRDLESAAEAIEDVVSNYEQHSRTAREVAREYFAYDRVLPVLLEQALHTGDVAPKTGGGAR